MDTHSYRMMYDNVNDFMAVTVNIEAGLRQHEIRHDGDERQRDMWISKKTVSHFNLGIALELLMKMILSLKGVEYRHILVREAGLQGRMPMFAWRDPNEGERMTTSDSKAKSDRKTRVAKKGGGMAARAVGGLGAPLAVSTLVASLGTASTGTAISTLSGAAATKATLAWLGGGALAAGGWGVAGGVGVIALMTVVGAIAAKKVYDKVTTSKD